MIITFFLNLIAIIVNVFASILNFLLGWTFPQGLQDAMTWLFHPLSFVGSFIDLPYLANILNYLFGFLIIFFIYRIIRLGWSAAFAWTGTPLSDIGGGEFKN